MNPAHCNNNKKYNVFESEDFLIPLIRLEETTHNVKYRDGPNNFQMQSCAGPFGSLAIYCWVLNEKRFICNIHDIICNIHDMVALVNLHVPACYISKDVPFSQVFDDYDTSWVIYKMQKLINFLGSGIPLSQSYQKIQAISLI